MLFIIRKDIHVNIKQIIKYLPGFPAARLFPGYQKNSRGREEFPANSRPWKKPETIILILKYK